MAWPPAGGDGATPHRMLHKYQKAGGTEEERNPHSGSIQEFRPKTVHATGSGDSSEVPSSQERCQDPHKEKFWHFGSVCSESVVGSVQGNLEIFWEQSQTLLKLDLKLSRTRFFASACCRLREVEQPLGRNQ